VIWDGGVFYSFSLVAEIAVPTAPASLFQTFGCHVGDAVTGSIAADYVGLNRLLVAER